ncbi:hypothetical protein AOQ84DRAFT_25731 [Glonium stellatum]|uniref:C2H2-type domain-containing protein n=1 Tax=Glonium stellatum TaxID=574774 RepID=A0A8E2JU59_9PEZI|nr:hypothetical protein AOQ84DRAFT_25731 [Glonium stellatum]
MRQPVDSRHQQSTDSFLAENHKYRSSSPSWSVLSVPFSHIVLAMEHLQTQGYGQSSTTESSRDNYKDDAGLLEPEDSDSDLDSDSGSSSERETAITEDTPEARIRQLEKRVNKLKRKKKPTKNYKCTVEECAVSFITMGSLLRHARLKAKSQADPHLAYLKRLEQKYCEPCRTHLKTIKAISQHRKSKHPDLFEALTGIKARPAKPHPKKAQPKRSTPKPSLTSTWQERQTGPSISLERSAIPTRSQDHDIASLETVDFDSFILSASYQKTFPFNSTQGNWDSDSHDVNPQTTKRRKQNENSIYESLPILHTQSQEYPHLGASDKPTSLPESRSITFPELDQDAQLVLGTHIQATEPINPPEP